MNVHLKRWLAVSGAAVVITAGVVVGGSYWRLESNLKTVDLAKEIIHPRPPSTPGRPLNILLIGKDDGRSDTAMVVQLNAKGDQARVVSIPRDTMVPRPRCGTNPPAAIAMFKVSPASFCCAFSDLASSEAIGGRASCNLSAVGLSTAEPPRRRTTPLTCPAGVGNYESREAYMRPGSGAALG